MNKNALTRKSTYKVGKTATGKLPASFGFPGTEQIKQSGGAYIRKLTKREQRIIDRLANNEIRIQDITTYR